MNGCPFCARIEAGEYDHIDMGVYDFEPLNPITPGHRLFVSSEHIEHAAAYPYIAGTVFEVAARWGTKHGPDFNLITSAGAFATQTVPHLHVHYIPRREGDGLHLPWTGQLRARQTAIACPHGRIGRHLVPDYSTPESSHWCPGLPA